MEELKCKLIDFSEGKISTHLAFQLAENAVKNVDFNNSTLAHKGINWYAKSLLEHIRY